jgi:hypothetical protein
MAGENTLTSLNTQFKYIQDKAQTLMPENAVLMKLVPEITEATKEGRKYLVPVQLSHENGVTYGDGSVFALNSASAAAYDEIEVDAAPIILLTQISESVANRMANSKQTFLTEATLRARVMYDSLARYLEISMLYGKSTTGWGTAFSTAQTGSTVVNTVVIDQAQWSAGIWGGAVGAVLEAYKNVGGTITKITDTTNTTCTVTKVVAATRTITFNCASATLSAAIDTAKASYVISFYPKGSYENDMIGLEPQIVGGVAYFGVDPTIYPLWQGQTYPCGSASLTMAKVLSGDALCVSMGGLNSEAVLMTSAVTYQNLNSDQAALRMYDQSYKAGEADTGTEGITYHGAGGKITVMVNNIVKEGEAFLVPPKYLSRVGAKELSFQRPGKTDEFFQEIPGYAGYSLRAGAEFAILLSRPAMACKYTAIVNS